MDRPPDSLDPRGPQPPEQRGPGRSRRATASWNGAAGGGKSVGPPGLDLRGDQPPLPLDPELEALQEQRGVGSSGAGMDGRGGAGGRFRNRVDAGPGCRQVVGPPQPLRARAVGPRRLPGRCRAAGRVDGPSGRGQRASAGGGQSAGHRTTELALSRGPPSHCRGVGRGGEHVRLAGGAEPRRRRRVRHGRSEFAQLGRRHPGHPRRQHRVVPAAVGSAGGNRPGAEAPPSTPRTRTPAATATAWPASPSAWPRRWAADRRR